MSHDISKINCLSANISAQVLNTKDNIDKNDQCKNILKSNSDDFTKINQIANDSIVSNSKNLNQIVIEKIVCANNLNELNENTSKQRNIKSINTKSAVGSIANENFMPADVNEKTF